MQQRQISFSFSPSCQVICWHSQALNVYPELQQGIPQETRGAALTRSGFLKAAGTFSAAVVIYICHVQNRSVFPTFACQVRRKGQPDAQKLQSWSEKPEGKIPVNMELVSLPQGNPYIPNNNNNDSANVQHPGYRTCPVSFPSSN